MRTQTVCIDCRYIRERPSGIATIVQALVEHLPALAPELSFLFLKHPKGPARLSTAANVREVVVTAEANGPQTLFWLSKRVDLRGVDLFHATFNILPHGLGMPTVVTMCDVMWIKYPHWAQSPGPWGFVERLFYQHGIKNALAHATRLVAISHATKSEIGTLDPKAEGRTRVAHEGVSMEVYRPLALEVVAAAKAKYLPEARRFVLAVGQFAPYKNHELVIRGFAHAFRDDADVHLAIVQRLGKGPEALGPIAAALGLGDRVHFLHGVPQDDLVALFNGALALCHPSLYEGFGNCPAEAMASGCPVVTSNRSSMPEVSGVAALLVEPTSATEVGSALRRVASEPELAASMRSRGLARAAELTWRAHAEATLATYREVL